MKTSLDQCLAYLGTQLRDDPGHRETPPILPSIAFSRQAGARAVSIAGAVADYLNTTYPPAKSDAIDQAPPWTVFDRSLVDMVLADHDLPPRVAQLLQEEGSSFLREALAELTGAMPTAASLVHQSLETILRLAFFGHAILVGRGATRICRDVPHVLRVRLVGSLERRVAHIQRLHQVTEAVARAYVADTDAARLRFLREHFDVDPDLPEHYHLIVNTDSLSDAQAGRLIGEAARALVPPRA